MTWLRRHPGVEFTARDRSNIYREALTKGVPEAMQVTDRWHLLYNLTLTLENFLLQKQPTLRKAALPGTEPEKKGDDAFGSGPIMPNRPRNRPQDRGGRKKAPRAASPAMEGHPPPDRHQRENRLPLQVSYRAATTSRLQEEEECPRPLRAVPPQALERGLPQRQATLPGDPRERLPKQRGDLRPLHGSAPSRRGPR